MSEEEEWHTCHFCGTQVNTKGYEVKGDRHFLSDCRPDLVEHEKGELCTWAFQRNNSESPDFPESSTCYAYENSDLQWTDEHKHFSPDGPM
jgi:hypothetical protein